MREPIIAGLAPALVTGLITAIINVLREFGVADISGTQIAAVNALAVSAMTVMAAVGVWWARRRATPVASPQLPEGTTVRTIDPVDGSVTGVTRV